MQPKPTSRGRSLTANAHQRPERGKPLSGGKESLEQAIEREDGPHQTSPPDGEKTEKHELRGNSLYGCHGLRAFGRSLARTQTKKSKTDSPRNGEHATCNRKFYLEVNTCFLSS
jgi:hypothetical protein